MIILPAIDIIDGEAVRLTRGDFESKKKYSGDPVKTALMWKEKGAHWLHIVDLDAAFSGSPRNLEHVKAICEAVNIPCEIGGGMRNFENVSAAFSAGAERVVLGTGACESVDYVREMCAEFGGIRIAVGIDSRDGKVAIKGWTETTTRSAAELALAVQEVGVRTIIATDIATDGMLAGPNFAALQELGELLDCDLIASGGVTTVDDLTRLAGLGCVTGAIIGKALYDGKIPIPLPKF